MDDTKNRPPLTQSGIVGKTPKRIFIMCSFSNFAGSIISAGPAPVNRKRHLLRKRPASPTSVTELSVWVCLLTRFNRRLPPEPYSDSEKDTLWNRPIPEGSLLLVKRSKFYISTSEIKSCSQSAPSNTAESSPAISAFSKRSTSEFLRP